MEYDKNTMFLKHCTFAKLVKNPMLFLHPLTFFVMQTALIIKECRFPFGQDIHVFDVTTEKTTLRTIIQGAATSLLYFSGLSKMLLSTGAKFPCLIILEKTVFTHGISIVHLILDATNNNPQCDIWAMPLEKKDVEILVNQTTLTQGRSELIRQTIHRRENKNCFICVPRSVLSD